MEEQQSERSGFVRAKATQRSGQGGRSESEPVRSSSSSKAGPETGCQCCAVLLRCAVLCWLGRARTTHTPKAEPRGTAEQGTHHTLTGAGRLSLANPAYSGITSSAAEARRGERRRAGELQ